MNIRINHSFDKVYSKIKDKKLLNKISVCIKSVIDSETLSKIGKCEKLEGKGVFYKIRIGNYRIGLRYENYTVIFLRFMHRKDIYKFFP